MPTRLSCACAQVPTAERGGAGHCRPSDRRPCTPDWPTPPQSGHSPSRGSPWPCNDQLLNLSLDPRPARASTRLRAIEFAGHEVAVPSQDRVRPGDIGHLAENLAAQSMTDLAERGSLGVRELQPPLQLGLQDAIFGGQIFNPRQQLLVHHPRDEGQNACPIHSSSTPADSQLLAQKIVASGTRRGYAGNGQLTVFSTVSIFWPYERRLAQIEE